jgi:ElaB/YqjD/DUF883 family membrane-anchored ribosome-binding protein
VDSQRELEVIRDEMEQTRANLADKLGALESQVRETVSSASETVASTVEGVKEVVTNVSETVENVTDTLNVPKQIEEHPWIALGIALAAGFVAAQMFSGSRHAAAGAPQPPKPEPQPEPRPEPRQEAHAAASGPSLLSQAASLLPSLESLVPDIAGKAAAAMPSLETLAPELKTLGDTVVNGLGGLAVGGVMNIVRELAAEALPDSWKGEITKLVDDLTQQLGGKPLAAKEEEEQKPSSPQKPTEGQSVQQKPNEQSQGNPRGRREGWNQLVGQG